MASPKANTLSRRKRQTKTKQGRGMYPCLDTSSYANVLFLLLLAKSASDILFRHQKQIDDLPLFAVQSGSLYACRDLHGALPGWMSMQTNVPQP